jgi:hypothetical protein
VVVGGKGGEITQTLYAHMNKKKNFLEAEEKQAKKKKEKIDL